MSTFNTKAAPAAADSDSEDDYMKMTFDDTTATASAIKKAPETSLQRRQRERREAEIRSRVKSKAELAAEEEARREAALSRSLFDVSSSTSSTLTGDASAKTKSKGLAMMAKMGFTGGALGKKPDPNPNSASGDGNGSSNGAAEAKDHRVLEPIRISIKDGREGIGLESERKRKLREAAERAGEAAKKARADEGEYRDRVRREREEARKERQLGAAQKVAERMDDEEDGIVTWTAGDEEGDSAGETERTKSRDVSSRLLKSLPVEYRGLVRGREQAEQDRRMRYDLEQSLSTRLPTYDDGDEDEDDTRALGKRTTAEARTTMYVTADDLDDEDEELDEFNALSAAERLERVVAYLRSKHRYCFWCKCAYPDENSLEEECPGMTEEDHD